MAKAFADFSEVDWRAYHAVQDALADGGEFDLLRLDDTLAEIPDVELRGAVRSLIVDGVPVPKLADCGPEGPVPWGQGPDGQWSTEGRAVEVESLNYSVALFRIVHGEPGVVGNLSTITGLTPNAIKARVAAVKARFEPDQLAKARGGLDPEELSALEKLYGSMDDPEVREFLDGVNSGRRNKPGSRGRGDWGTAA